MIETINFNNVNYPAFQAKGNSSQIAIPFALHVCKGVGYDIGCNKVEWSFPGSIPIDPVLDDQWHAGRLPFEKNGQVDYIYSSHCLEHVTESWFGILSYWVTNIKKGGTLFLYLPDFSQEYWRPWNNKKHLHVFTPYIIKDALYALKLKNIFVSGIDLNNSFTAIGEV
jgi:hypothetical protein